MPRPNETEGDDSFFLGLERAAKLLSVADRQKSVSQLKGLFDGLKADRDHRRPAPRKEDQPR